MADKSEFVDMISQATRQTPRRVIRRIVEPAPKERSRLGHWSQRMEQWRMETFTPWKLKPWKCKDWD